jgi:hypothetical protein
MCGGIDPRPLLRRASWWAIALLVILYLFWKR